MKVEAHSIRGALFKKINEKLHVKLRSEPWKWPVHVKDP